MEAKEYWQLFLETGAPEAYLLYSKQVKSEVQNVLDHSGRRPAGDGLQ